VSRVKEMSLQRAPADRAPRRRGSNGLAGGGTDSNPRSLSKESVSREGGAFSVRRLKPVPGAIGSSSRSLSSGGPLAGTTGIWAERSVRYLAVDENC
jgi:hypothetical protein